MPMIIENTDDLVVVARPIEIENTETFSINFGNNTVGGRVDDEKAIQQSIYLMLNIEADQYIIYPYTYGMKKVDLIGKPHSYVMAVLPERIRETLLRDNRIKDVSNFTFEIDRNKLHCTFEVQTMRGSIKSETVVTI